MKGIELSKIKKEYKFTTNQQKEITEAKNRMLAKYKNVEAKQSVELVKSGWWIFKKVKLRTIITLTSK